LVVVLVLPKEYALSIAVIEPVLMPKVEHILDLVAIVAIHHQLDWKQLEVHYQMDSIHLVLFHHHLLRMGFIKKCLKAAITANVSCLVADNSSSLSCCILIFHVL
jgi:hypothetical protein